MSPWAIFEPCGMNKATVTTLTRNLWRSMSDCLVCHKHRNKDHNIPMLSQQQAQVQISQQHRLAKNCRAHSCGRFSSDQSDFCTAPRSGSWHESKVVARDLQDRKCSLYRTDLKLRISICMAVKTTSKMDFSIKSPRQEASKQKPKHQNFPTRPPRV